MTPRRKTSRLRMAALLLFVVAALLFGDLVRLSLQDAALQRRIPRSLRRAIVQITGFKSHERRIRVGFQWKYETDFFWSSVAFGDFLQEGELGAIVRNEDRSLTATTLDGTVLNDLHTDRPMGMSLVAGTTLGYQQWAPVALQRSGRDLLLVFDNATGTLLALDAKTEQSVWETPLPGTVRTWFGGISPFYEEGETRGLLVVSPQSRHLFFLSAEGELLAKTNLEPDSLVFEGIIDEAAVVFAAEPSGHIRVFDTKGNEQRRFRLRYPEGLSPLSLIAVEGEDGSPALRADFMNRQPLYFSFDGSVLASPAGEPSLTFQGVVPWMRTTLLPNGNILASMYGPTLLDRHGRVVDQLAPAGGYAFLITGVRSADGRHLMWVYDQMGGARRLCWVEVKE